VARLKSTTALKILGFNIKDSKSTKRFSNVHNSYNSAVPQ
jgi:hypothetical protein